MRRVVKVPLGLGVLGLVVTGALAASAPAAPIANASKCVAARNIEAIVDDSGSMAGSDPDRLRVEALKLLSTTALSPPTQLGAVEFGSGGFFGESAADTVFPPQSVANADEMVKALKQKIQADNGATDYNAAFAQSDADNPSADARIFLTDGGHNIGAYNEGHLVHRVPTYVIGFGTEFASAEDVARLEKIATDTGTTLYSAKDLVELQPVVREIGTALTCDFQLKKFIDQLAQGQRKLHAVAIPAAAPSIQITLTWASPLDKFKAFGLRLLGGGKTIAVAARTRKPSKLKVTTTTGKTFAVLKVSGLKKGKLRFGVKAAKVGSGVPKATLTTQVTQGRHK